VSDAAVPFEDIAAAPDVRDAELTEPGPLEALPGALREPVAGPRILGMDPVVVERKRVAAEAWQRVVDAQASGARLEGIVKRAIPGGLAVEIDGVAGFVPASQIRVPIGVDAASLVGSQQPLVVLDVDEKRRRAVVSQRRAVDARQREERAELLADADPAEYALGEAIQLVVRSADRRTRKINLSLPHAIAVRPSSTGFASLGEELARPKR